MINYLDSFLWQFVGIVPLIMRILYIEDTHFVSMVARNYNSRTAKTDHIKQNYGSMVARNYNWRIDKTELWLAYK